MYKFKNVKTGEYISRNEPTEEEYVYADKPLLVETDKNGVITYVNRRFVEVSGYTKEELIGSPHCAQMHPNMPVSIFKDACQKTSEGKTWNGYVCNITKEGVGYWTEMTVQPKWDDNGEIVGFMATRKAVDPDRIEAVIEEYETIKVNGDGVLRSQYCGEVFMDRGACRI